jgi:naphthoate synthase
MTFEDITMTVDDGVAVIAINRPERGNTLRVQTATDLLAAFQEVRSRPELDVAVLTGAGDKFFCIGGEHEGLKSLDYSSVMPVVDLYEFIDTMPKPVVAAVNGYAVGGGNVLQVVCDLSIAAPHAVFRQVGPLVGSFDAGYGTWYLEETIGRKRAKEMWYLNKKYTAQQALDFGLVNEVVEDGGDVVARAVEVAQELRGRGPFALAALKTAFSGRHSGVAGQARMAHDLLLTAYRSTQEADEMSAAFDERRPPDRTKFYR